MVESQTDEEVAGQVVEGMTGKAMGSEDWGVVEENLIVVYLQDPHTDDPTSARRSSPGKAYP